ncbi:S1 family peptidase [Vibrio sinaloensis]|uniref:S1 family peptidase n=1 Tax=Photobacterium sp. (strain ATCC 43367) TaxID=379097 RepID=UPI001E5FCDC5|nr:trypsin-like serine protease [Vibrio sinaloensis]
MYDVGSSFTKDIFMKRLALVLSMLASASSHGFESNPYIVNGSPASVSEFPTFSSLYFDNGKYYGNYCGSTVINENYILTAAHCIYGAFDQMLHTNVVLGVENKNDYLSGKFESVRAAEFYYPDNYEHSEVSAWPNDIAIIKLARPLAGNPDYYNHLNLNVSKGSLEKTTGYMALGHGLVNGNVASDGQLLKTDLTFTDDSNCDNTKPGQLCFDGQLAGGYKNSTCNGDSGGPVYKDFGTGTYIQVGITSYGPATCGDPSFAATSVFTNVNQYQNWIYRVINGGETPKYHIVAKGSDRQLIENSTSKVKASSEHVDASSSSGGSLGLFSVLLLGALSLRDKIRR